MGGRTTCMCIHDGRRRLDGFRYCLFVRLRMTTACQLSRHPKGMI